MYRFLENFETGIPFIDNGHRRLLEDMEEAREALAAGHEDEYHRLIGQILATMHDHIVKQHVYEEEIMAMSRDGELANQKEAHAHFREVIDRHKSSMNFQNDQEELVSLLHFLNEWFLQHILSSDMLIGSALKKAKAAAAEAKAKAAKEARAAEATHVKAKKAPADPFAFTDEFRTQIPLVDKEHETLFNLVRQTYELVHDEFCVDKFDGIVEILEELRNYTIKHFADEERYMKSINYGGLAEQVAAHTAFVEKLNNIDLDEIDRDQEDALDKLIKFLLNWLVQHILKVDKKMPYIEEAALKLTE